MADATGDFPLWKLVYYYFSVWKNASIFEILQESLVEKLRVKHGKKEEPTVGIIDAQSVKNTLVSCENKGFDAGKKIKGIKRHIIVDTLGLVLAVVIQNASVQDRDEAVDFELFINPLLPLRPLASLANLARAFL